MKAQEMDKKLKKLIQEVQLDKPGNNFTTAVMNRVFEEKAAMEKVKNETVFGKGFWTIVFLFSLLLIAVAVFSLGGIELQTEPTNLFGETSSERLNQGYKSFFSNLGTLPLSMGGILFATSILLFFDKILYRFMPNQSGQKLV